MLGKSSSSLVTDDMSSVTNQGEKHGSVIHESEDLNLITATSGETPYLWASRFEDLNLSPELMKCLYVEMKFTKPRNVQAKSLPMIMTPPHKHLIAQAHNGSGKTTCFVVGMLSRVDPTLPEPQALCICPTSELANQNLEVLEKMGKYTGITAELAVPEAARGVPITKRAPVFAHVVIGTPGTIKRWINFKKLGVTNIKILVFDEPDLILAMDGFRDDSFKVMKDIKKVNPYFQVLIFSAILNEVVKEFAASVVKDPNQVFVQQRRRDIGVVINDLPDEVICHILSFLPTKTAASTSVLSRRWRYLLATVPNLDFDDSIYLHPHKLTPWCRAVGMCVIYVNDKWHMRSTSFVDFVDKVLALHHGFTLEKFSLKTIYIYDPVDPERVVPWINKALALNVSDLHLVMNWGQRVHFLLPSNIFSSKTLVRLIINNVGEDSTIDVDDFHLPKLKTLHLKSVSFGKENTGFSKLVAGCKVLEELTLEGIRSYMWESFSVSHTTLKTLKFGSEQHKEAFHSPSSVVSFDTPNLVYLECTQVLARKYLRVNFDSLVEAKIDFRLTSEQERKAMSSIADAELEAYGNEENYLFGDATKFIKGICNVQRLFLSRSTLEVLTFCCKAIPIFSNLTHLTIKSMQIFEWESLAVLLKRCPNVETLLFKGLLHQCRDDVYLCKSEDLTFLSTSHVKVVKIFIDDGKTEKHIEQVKHLLGTMTNLEQLVLYYDSSSFDEDLIQVSTQLQMRASLVSPKCNVQLIPNLLNAITENVWSLPSGNTRVDSLLFLLNNFFLFY